MISHDQNLVILTLYIIGVAYVFNRMVESIDDQIKFEFKKAIVEEQLQAQNLTDKIGISFKFKSSYPIDDLKELSLSIENKSQDIAISVEWDSSSLVVENSKESRRVIRKSPDLIRDLAVPQGASLVAPQKTLSQTVTAEDVFVRDKETGTYSPTKPIISINGMSKAGGAQKKLYNDFMKERKEIEFSLQLVLRIMEVNVGLVPNQYRPSVLIINCPFSIRKLPWTYALPWNKKR